MFGQMLCYAVGAIDECGNYGSTSLIEDVEYEDVSDQRIEDEGRSIEFLEAEEV